MEKVKIVADSTCDLSQELLDRYQIEVIPLPVNLGDKPCLDGVDVHPEDLFAYYKETGKLPTTSAPTPAYYEELYQKWTEEGYSVVHLSISLAFTVTHNIARMASESFPNIHPVDSRNISAGMGILAIQAAKLRDQGLAAAEIAEAVRGMTERVQTSFILDTLQFMYKGGRCTGVAALGANLLNLKPCIEVRDGSMEVGKKYRGKLGTVLEQYTEARLKDKNDIDLEQILIAQCGVDREILDRVVNKIKECQPFKEVLVLDTGCSVSVHCGPNTLGLIYMTAQAGA
ncbi:MAG: DegV family protein [Clostridiales bacterium]|jgi:DegV family protein with EDD domain|nr:DegV family protein [Clostridiales bacterium]